MSIVLNECLWAENAIDSKTLGKKPYETLCRVAKYYTYNGCSKNETRQKLEDFLLSCDPTVSVVSWADTLDAAVKHASKYAPVVLEHISVTQAELDIIDKLPGMQLRRLAFTLLCIAKYMFAVNPDTDFWVNTPDNEIMKMANINTSIKRQCLMFSQLRDLGLIQFSKKVDNLSVRVLFADNGEAVLNVTDFRNLGYQYMMLHSNDYYVCQVCGITDKYKDRKHGGMRKYCVDCALKVKTQQQVNSVMRHRNAGVK